MPAVLSAEHKQDFAQLGGVYECRESGRRSQKNLAVKRFPAAAAAIKEEG